MYPTHNNLLSVNVPDVEPVLVRSYKEAKPITIEPVANGFIVKIGCQIFVFTDIEKLTENMKKYYSNPFEMERSFENNGSSVLV